MTTRHRELYWHRCLRRDGETTPTVANAAATGTASGTSKPVARTPAKHMRVCLMSRLFYYVVYVRMSFNYSFHSLEIISRPAYT